MRFWCRCLGNGPFPCRINTARVKPTAQHPVKCYNFGKELLLPMFFIFLPASFSPPNSQKRSQWKMLFQIIEISKNFFKSPQGMLPGHIFLSHGMGMSPLAMEGGWWGHWGNIPGEHPRAASLPFPLHLVASGVIPSTPSKSICCRASPSQLPQQIGEFLVFFFLFGCSVFRAAWMSRCPSPHWQAGGKLTKALLTRAVLPDFRGERFFCQRTAGLGQSSPYCYLWSIAETRERW